MFRVYRMTGGDDADINVKKFAARYLTYLILRAIGTLTVTTTDPRVFVTALQDADELTVNFEGHPGGAWHKVIRWSFEKQGLFQPPGAPHASDPARRAAGRRRVHQRRPQRRVRALPDQPRTSPGVWNRLAADGGTANQEPTAGVTNYLYVRVGNRGRLQAQGVSVKCYQGKAGSALGWPADWTPLTTASLPGPAIAAGGSTIIGPFQWTPTQAGRSAFWPACRPRVTPATPTRSTAPSPTAAWCRTTTTWPSVTLRRAGSLAAASASRSAPARRLQAAPTGSPTPATRVSTWTWTPAPASSPPRPRYFTTLGGNSSHWATTGATSIYNATPTGFRVYVRWSDGSALTPAQANSFQWHVNWLALRPRAQHLGAHTTLRGSRQEVGPLVDTAS